MPIMLALEIAGDAVLNALDVMATAEGDLHDDARPWLQRLSRCTSTRGRIWRLVRACWWRRPRAVRTNSDRYPLRT
ncbi:hypothetical protein BK634_11825 [Pseudomonas chlororaphis]|nr:hypothetical protein BK634_11825 [Pseudomonas chlororaphis]